MGPPDARRVQSRNDDPGKSQKWDAPPPSARSAGPYPCSELPRAASAPERLCSHRRRGRVGPGSYLPGPPTDPDVRISRIRLLGHGFAARRARTTDGFGSG